MSRTRQKERELGIAAEKGYLLVVRRLLFEGVNPNNFEYVSSYTDILLIIS